MADLFGKKYTRRELEARVGTMKQIADVRRAVMTDGKEDGTHIIEMSNGLINATIVESRCMDIAGFSYKGVPLNFTGKNGIVFPAFAEPVENPLRSVNGGMFYTCGLSNVGGRYGDDYFHGKMRLLPAEHAYAFAEWEDDEYFLFAGGIMRQNGVCLENLSLERKITTSLCSKTISIEDTVRNDGFNPYPFMMMYHVVFGFPLLDEEAKLYLPCESRSSLLSFEQPSDDGCDSDSGLHKVGTNDDGESTYCLFNHRLELGLSVTFNSLEMPYLSQWKSMQSGDYALGVMPSNCLGAGREEEINNGSLKYIDGGEVKNFKLVFNVLDGIDDLNSCLEKIGHCTNI